MEIYNIKFELFKLYIIIYIIKRKLKIVKIKKKELI